MKRNRAEISEPVSVNFNACDGCGMCVQVCPSEVFTMRELIVEEVRELSFFGRLKVRIKGNVKSEVVAPDACLLCGKCADNCHEKAITVNATCHQA